MQWGPDCRGEQSFVCSEVSKSYYHYLEEKKSVLGGGCSNDVLEFNFNMHALVSCDV